MALDPKKDPKLAISFLIAVGLCLFRPGFGIKGAFDEAEAIVKEGERRYGAINLK